MYMSIQMHIKWFRKASYDYIDVLEVRNNGKKAKDITICLEYALCVFRL